MIVTLQHVSAMYQAFPLRLFHSGYFPRTENSMYISTLPDMKYAVVSGAFSTCNYV